MSLERIINKYATKDTAGSSKGKGKAPDAHLSMEHNRKTGGFSLHVGTGSSRRKIPHLVDEDLDDLSDSSAAENVVAPRAGRKKPQKPQKPQKLKKPPTEAEYHRALSSMGFSGTRYPHRQTMSALGILKDVGSLFRDCNLTTFMMEPHAGYKDETCQFLASLGVNFHGTEAEALDAGHKPEEMGFITFDINDVGYLLEISKIDEAFGFPTGPGYNQDINPDELQNLWKFIATGSFSSSRSKGSHIRNPAVRYLHKSLASTFFARKVTGPVNDGEMRMMVIALKDLMDSSGQGVVYEGDRAGAGLSIVLLDQLLGYREWADKLHRNRQKSELTVGGIVTPILMAAGVELRSQPYEPKWLDITNLGKQHLLDQKYQGQGHLYRFIHPVIGNAFMVLPNTELTRIRVGRNIDFLPPVEALYNPNEEPIREEPLEHAQEEADHMDEEGPEPEGFNFENEPPVKTLKEANHRIGLLGKLVKWQGKALKALKNTVKGMGAQIKELSKAPRSPSQMPLRRSGSFSFRPRERAHVDPPRSSEVDMYGRGEPSRKYQRRRRKRATTEHEGEHSGAALGHEPEPEQEERLDSMDVDRAYQPESHPFEHSMEMGRAEYPEPSFHQPEDQHSMDPSRAVPTEPSMDDADAYINAFFSPP